ncbi:hypothetical protein [Ketobacter sp.]|uniref:hypothetical protein n=1 Tax=Ketobacter sp. TaxID=2083498 RepID=UPI0025C372C6|nr:hypothetical protein [Ketobacter sp.]
MQKLFNIAMLSILLLVAARAPAGIVVIVNNENPVSELSKREIIDLYMGRNLYFSDGKLALRLDHPPTSGEREQFYQTLVKKSVAQMNAYWAKLLFTGRASPPLLMGDSEQLLDTVRNNRNAIGYIDESNLDDSVKVVGRVD